VQWFFDEIVGDRSRREQMEQLRKEQEEYDRKVREGMEMLNKPIPIPPIVKPAPQPSHCRNLPPPTRPKSPEMRRGSGRGGKQRQRDSGLAKEKDADVSRKARDKSHQQVTEEGIRKRKRPEVCVTKKNVKKNKANY
jgi:hypothetical protein